MALKRLILLGLLAASLSFAAPILLYLPGTGTDAALGEDIYLSINGTVADDWAGGINADIGGTGTGSNGDPRVVFCVQATIDISPKHTYDTVIDFANTAPATLNTADLERVAWLLANDYPTDAVTGAGFQLAIWDIMEDSGDGFSSGIIQAATGTNATNTTVLSDAQGYEKASLGKAFNLAYVYIDTDPSNNGAAAQDLIGFTPEPSSLFLIVGGMALIGLGRWRRRRARR